MLEQINPEQIDNLEDAQTIIGSLLNMLETALSENRVLKKEFQEMKDELNRLKGEQGKPNIKASKKAAAKDHSSEKERRQPKKRQKAKKRAKIVIHEERKLIVDKSELPPDATYKGCVEVVVQDIEIKPNNICFLKEKYYSPSTGLTYLAPMPAGYEGEFGPGLRALIPALYHSAGMTEPKISEFLTQFELSVSDGQISNILTKGLDEWHAEKAAIIQAGLTSTNYQHSDDTETRVNGVKNYCHILCNDYYTAYFTRPYKSRLTIIHLLQGTERLQLWLNEQTQIWLDDFKVPKNAQALIAQWPHEEMISEAEMKTLIDRDLSHLNDQQQARVWEAAALTAYGVQDQTPQIDILLTDDAPQFCKITHEHALCWIHEGRHYKKLIPYLDYHRKLLDNFLKRFWAFYRQLLAYRQNPRPPDATRLRKHFERLFSTVTGYDELDRRIVSTKSHADKLLLVLDYPQLPLHNNPAELGARQRVRKRNISFGPRTQDGLQAWDTFATIAETAKKLGVSFYAYLYDRVSKSYALTSLADLINLQVAHPLT